MGTLVLAAVSSTVSFNGYVRCKSETKAIRDNNGLDTGSYLACNRVSRRNGRGELGNSDESLPYRAVIIVLQ